MPRITSTIAHRRRLDRLCHELQDALQEALLAEIRKPGRTVYVDEAWALLQPIFQEHIAQYSAYTQVGHLEPKVFADMVRIEVTLKEEVR